MCGRVVFGYQRVYWREVGFIGGGRVGDGVVVNGR